MPLNNIAVRTFFGDSTLDDNLPLVNEVFWSALIGHIEQDYETAPRAILDIGCHTGGLLFKLERRFAPSELFGIEPLIAAREVAMARLNGTAAKTTLLDTSEWDQVPTGAIDLISSHEVLYLEPDLGNFMTRIRRVLTASRFAYLVLGCHSENPLWPVWKQQLSAAGQQVYDHAPMEIMAAASAAGLAPSVQPLRRSGWISYNPLKAVFQYPDARTMLDHHYRHKLVFRLIAT
jgi:SAM-dependent methyltransferase